MEFGGGALTGRLVSLALAGCALLVLAMALAFMRPRTGTVVASLAAVFCLPLDVYRTAPSSLSWLASAPASVRSGGAIHLDAPALGSLLAIAVMLGLHLVLSPRRRTAVTAVQ